MKEQLHSVQQEINNCGRGSTVQPSATCLKGTCSSTASDECQTTTIEDENFAARGDPLCCATANLTIGECPSSTVEDCSTLLEQQQPQHRHDDKIASVKETSSVKGEGVIFRPVISCRSQHTAQLDNPHLQERQQQLPSQQHRRRIIRRKNGTTTSINPVPNSIIHNQELQHVISSSLPKDYTFEIYKTIHRIQQSRATHVALQMPEGLLMYGCIIADILVRFAWIGSGNGGCTSLHTTSALRPPAHDAGDKVANGKTLDFDKKSRELKQIKSSSVPRPSKLRVSIMGDVTYGACCIDDLTARALGADLLIHYGHSCLVPITSTVIPCLYVFVEINSIDLHHMVDCVCHTLKEGTSVEVMGTIQFRSAVGHAAVLLTERHRPAHVPQAKPLSPGEVLGCTAPTNLQSTPRLSAGDSPPVMLFVADGRFHLEAAMIANPDLRALRYDPYGKSLTEERYENDKMKRIRRDAISRARHSRLIGIILGTLGRQGNPSIVGRVRQLIRSKGLRCFVILLSEIFPGKLDMMPHVDAWVQVACPRLSVDWGHFFNKPVLSPYELEVCLESTNWKDIYPMDFYSSSSGPWSNYHQSNRDRQL